MPVYTCEAHYLLSYYKLQWIFLKPHRVSKLFGDRLSCQLLYSISLSPHTGASTDGTVTLQPCEASGVFRIWQRGGHGERAEREPITGVWGRSPQRGPGAEPP